MQMTNIPDPQDVLSWTISRMHGARKDLMDLAEGYAPAVSGHGSICDNLFMDALQAQSMLDDIDREELRRASTPSDMTQPSPPREGEDNATLHCNETMEDCLGGTSDSSDSNTVLNFLLDTPSSDGVEYDPEDSDNTE